jgi:Aldose 1-epimerase
VTLTGAEKSSLTLQWSVRNPTSATDAFSFTNCLHPYFAVRDIEEVCVRNLANLRFRDKTKENQEFRTATHQDELRFTSEVDGVYYDAPDVMYISQDGASIMRVTKKGFTECTLLCVAMFLFLWACAVLLSVSQWVSQWVSGSLGPAFALVSVHSFTSLHAFITPLTHVVLSTLSIPHPPPPPHCSLPTTTVVIWNPWLKKAKAMSDFADAEYRRMVCVEPGVIHTPHILTPGSTWTGTMVLEAL